jgi:SAM-dependent methyltransferase
MNISEILEKSDYQTFDFLGDRKKGSNSGKKYELSKLEEFDLYGKTCLDVGCNAGYFLFRFLGRDPKILIGIDLGKRFIDIANELNREHFKSDILTFICGDFFSFDFKEKFDLIICFSTFHYLVGKQKDFLDGCFNLLNVEGILLLEVEEYPKNDVPDINHDPRPYDKDKIRLDYPNNLKMREFVSGKFDILDRYISVKQTGELYGRYFYKLQKI